MLRPLINLAVYLPDSHTEQVTSGTNLDIHTEYNRNFSFRTSFAKVLRGWKWGAWEGGGGGGREVVLGERKRVLA